MSFGRKDAAISLLLGLSLGLVSPVYFDAAALAEPDSSSPATTGDSTTKDKAGEAGTAAPANSAANGSAASASSLTTGGAAGNNSGNGASPTGASPPGGSSPAEHTNEQQAAEHKERSSEHKEASSGSHLPAHAEHVPSSGRASATEYSGDTVERSNGSAAPSSPAVQKPLKLYGRIEELCAVPGAKLPLKMKAMVPIRDASLDAKSTNLSGKASTLAAGAKVQQYYPTDYIGSWAGDLTVYTSSFDKTYFQRDPDEARKESQIMRSGQKGQYSVSFYQGKNNRIQMQPSQVIFTTSESMGSQMKLLSRSQPGLGAMLGPNNPMANMQVPVMVALHMGTPISSGEIGVTGNQLSSELMKNTLKQLSPGVLENQIVTRDRDRNPETGKVQEGYSESVLRFTRLNRDQLYLQAAYVYYRNDGQFQAKYVLYGTLNRSSGTNTAYPAPAANPMNIFGGSGSPFGGGAGNPFGGGAGNLQQQMQNMQKLLQKMNGN